MRTLFLLRGSPACVDKDTEYFNGHEWKSIDSYTEGDMVLQYTESGVAELVKPIDYIKTKCLNDFIYIRNCKGSVNQKVSQNHDIAYLTSKMHLNKKKAIDVYKSHLNTKSGFNGKFINSFKFNGSLLIPEEKLRLMIAISADGNLCKNLWRVRIFKKYKIQRLRALLEQNNITIDERVYKDGSHNFYIPKEFGVKEFPLEFYNLDERSKLVFKDEIFRWDGDQKSIYRTTIKQNADITQFILSQFGTRVFIGISNRIGQPMSNPKYVRKSICYIVHLTSFKYSSMEKKGRQSDIQVSTIKSEDGFQYCFTVPSGYLVLRRNNTIFITGNCGKSTWVEQNGLEAYTLSADKIRTMIQSPVYNIQGKLQITQKNDNSVWDMLYQLLEDKMKRGEFCIIDATHYKHELISKYKSLVTKYRYRAYIVDFTNVSKEELLRRNSLRDEYKRVPEETIEKMTAVFEAEKISKQVPSYAKTLTQEEALSKIKEEPLYDFNEFDKIVAIPDLHGCYEPLDNYFKDHPFNDNTFYIFLGDYLDRGLQNKEVMEFLLSIYNKKNVLMLEGNHEKWLRKYCSKEQPIELSAGDMELLKSTVTKFQYHLLREKNKRSHEFDIHTIPQIKDIDKSLLRQFCDKLGQFAHIKYGDKVYTFTHGGISNKPNLLMSSEEMIDGIGEYGENEQVYKAWNENTPSNYVQFHGHRNIYSIQAKYDDKNYNLNSSVEFGEDLRIAEITKDGVDILLYKNSMFRERKFDDKKEITLTLNVETSNDLYKALNESRYIVKKQLNNDIVSYNFSRDAFYKGVWNSLIIKARGLFINSRTQNVVARSYDKFFNIGEQLFTEIRNLKSNLVFPVTAYKKENGFLGIVSWDKDNNELFIASKSTNEGDFAGMVRKHFDELDKKDDIIEYLKQNNVTFVFEVVDIEKDPHIIKYDESCIYLLDIISNKLEKCEKMSFDEMCKIADKFDLNHKQKEFIFNDWSEFLKFYTEVEKNNSIQIEGWVFEDQNEFMVKFKTPYYKFWKYIRSIKDALCKERKIPQVFKSAEEVNIINFMKRMSIDELSKKSIIDIREEFNRESK